MNTLIHGGRVVNEGKIIPADIVVDGNHIATIGGSQPEASYDQTIDASGCYVIPGVIDSHVHFREPGLTEKADIDSESRAAAAGGVTTYFDMPNCKPQTTTPEALDDKFRRAAASSYVNYSFFYGATNTNIATLDALPAGRIPGIKLFMGSSTGNMLIDDDAALERLFAQCRLPLMAHCEDSATIDRNMQTAIEAWGEDPPVSLHATIRSEEACLLSTRKAVALARRHGTRLHVAHVSTADELDLFETIPTGTDTPLPLITAEACVGYLLFTQLDHQTLGARIKVNPAIKTPVDQFMLRQALADRHIATIATDHAPHLASQKQGGCRKAASGMPMVQFALPAMLELTDQHVLSLTRLVELMCHTPARLFGVSGRGFLRPGYSADITILRPHSPWTVTPDIIESKCGWSPVEGHRYDWRVERTICNGQTVYAYGQSGMTRAGEAVKFNRS